jgi:hypothetical protein
LQLEGLDTDVDRRPHLARLGIDAHDVVAGLLTDPHRSVADVDMFGAEVEGDGQVRGRDPGWVDVPAPGAHETEPPCDAPEMADVADDEPFSGHEIARCHGSLGRIQRLRRGRRLEHGLESCCQLWWHDEGRHRGHLGAGGAQERDDLAHPLGIPALTGRAASRSGSHSSSTWRCRVAGTVPGVGMTVVSGAAEEVGSAGTVVAAGAAVVAGDDGVDSAASCGLSAPLPQAASVTGAASPAPQAPDLAGLLHRSPLQLR